MDRQRPEGRNQVSDSVELECAHRDMERCDFAARAKVDVLSEFNNQNSITVGEESGWRIH